MFLAGKKVYSTSESAKKKPQANQQIIHQHIRQELSDPSVLENGAGISSSNHSTNPSMKMLYSIPSTSSALSYPPRLRCPARKISRVWVCPIRDPRRRSRSYCESQRDASRRKGSPLQHVSEQPRKIRRRRNQEPIHVRLRQEPV